MSKRFLIEMCSDRDFEGMAIYISYGVDLIAIVNYDKGIDNIEIIIQPGLEKLYFPLKDFFKILEKAKKLAIKCAKEDKLSSY